MVLRALWLLIGLVCVAVFASPASADWTDKSVARMLEELRSASTQKWLTSEKISVITDPELIPGPVKLLYHKNIDVYGIAALQEPFSSGCVREGNEPGTRLILAGDHRPYYFVAYEQGGRSLHIRVALFKLRSKGAVFLGSEALHTGDYQNPFTIKEIIGQLKTMEAASARKATTQTR